MYIQIAILIVVIVGVVHFVYEKGKKDGMKSGIDKGRMEILEENIKRADLVQPAIDRKLVESIETKPIN